ncbi:hypothetical protein BZA77DRAFT_311254 [Pyronema omphalodes]|nr:hypothetical protein BZA77DRAFT_311254 [Pyronema omphalodes]
MSTSTIWREVMSKRGRRRTARTSTIGPFCAGNCVGYLFRQCFLHSVSFSALPVYVLLAIFSLR